MDTYWEVLSQSWLWEDDPAFDESLIVSDWTFEEDRAFENALIAVHPNDVERWEKIALRVPGKTVEELKHHYEALSGDVYRIESGEVPSPHSRRKDSVPRSSIRSPGSSMPRHPKEGSSNDGKKLLPKEGLTNIRSQMLPPTSFDGTHVHTDAGVCTSSPAPPASSSGVFTSYSDYIDPDEFKNFPHFLD